MRPRGRPSPSTVIAVQNTVAAVIRRKSGSSAEKSVTAPREGRTTRTSTRAGRDGAVSERKSRTAPE